MGNCVKIVSSSVSVIADESLWIESDAIQQLIKTSQLSNIKRAVGMPDLHPGRGYPVGAAFLSQEYIYPALIGNDIGCGMGLWTTDIATHKVKLDRLEQRIGNVENSTHDLPSDLIQERLGGEHSLYELFIPSLGTIGGGNHFAELQALDTVFSQALFNQVPLDAKNLVLLVHSGSRGLGEKVLRNHISNYSHVGVAVASDGFSEYFKQHNQALSFAKLNRELIAQKILTNIKATGKQVLDVAHNLLEP